MASDSNTTPASSGGGEYSMAFVTVPNMEVGKKIAGGLGKENTIYIKSHAFS